MMKIFLYLLILFLIGTSAIFAQLDSLYLHDKLNVLLEESSEEIEDGSLYEYLDQLRDDPIDLNSASINDLLKIPFLDFSSASQIINIREVNGIFSSKDQLYEIETFPKEIIDRIYPFVIVRKSSIKKFFASLDGEIRSRTITDIQEKEGFVKERFLGNKNKSYNRMKIRFGDKAKLNLLAEKDAGENSYFDFTSFSFSIERILAFDRIAVGDFTSEFGQGLVLWSPYGFGKNSASTGSIIKSERRFTSYASSDENRFFRGGAVKVLSGIFSSSVFYSSKNIDSRIDTISGAIISIPIDGYHRTESELVKKKKLKENIFGVSGGISLWEKLSLSCLYLNEKLDALVPIQNNYYSIAYSLVINNLLIKGETASDGKNISSIISASVNLSKNFNFITSFRNYNSKYSSRFANALSESSSPNNEIGFYTGFDLRTKLGRSTVYFDIFKFPHSSFYSNFPSSGNEFSIYHEFIPAKKTKLRFNLKFENKEVENVFGGKIISMNRKILRYKFDLTKQLSKSIRLKSRIEFANYNDGVDREKGALVYQDINFRHLKSISFYGRIIFFKTDSFNSRVYEFENDLTGTMYNPALYGEGIRWYFLMKYQPLKNVVVSGKYSETYKPDERFLGSGLTKINNNLDNRISFQLDIYF